MQYTKKGPIAALQQWQQTIQTALPHLSQPQAQVLALWSFGIVLAQHCGLTTVSTHLADLLHKKPATLRQQLREWYKAGDAKKGQHRRSLEVQRSFGPLLRWVVALWPPQHRKICLALDATTLKSRLTVLSVSVIYRNCAIPVAWTVVSTHHKGAWRPHWLALLSALQDTLDGEWTVVVTADRGLYASWLFTHICTLGWHPLLRINATGLYRRESAQRWRSLQSAITHVGGRVNQRVTCFKETPISATLVGCWTEGHAEPWLLVTDLAPRQVQAAWYGLRSSIECGFRDTKSDGWQWQRTQMTDPTRAERVWLALAVATMWMVNVGGAAEETDPLPNRAALPATHVVHRLTKGKRPSRLVSVFKRGLSVVRAALVRGETAPLGLFRPLPWPRLPTPSKNLPL